MSSTQVPVEASILQSLIDMFFKGFDKIFDQAIQYRNEMGVLKSVTEIPVVDASKTPYTVYVKLSPVKNKESVYFVEVDIQDKDGKSTSKFNVSQLHEKALKIDKTSMKDFNKAIQNLLNQNHLTKVETDDSSSAEDGESFEIECYRDEDPVDTNVSVSIQVTEYAVKGQSDKFLLDIKVLDDPHNLITDPYKGDNKARSAAEDDKIIDQFLIDNQLITSQELEEAKDSDDAAAADDVIDDVINESTKICVTLRNVSSAEQLLDLTAVTASNCSPASADNIITNIAFDLIPNIPEGEERSFSILEEGDSYVVDEIPSVNRADAYVELFNIAAGCWLTVQQLDWLNTARIDCECGYNAVNQARDGLSTLVNFLAKCILLDTDRCISFNDVAVPEIERNIGDQVYCYLGDILCSVVEAADLYLPNFEYDEQQQLQCIVGEIRELSKKAQFSM